MSTSFFSLPPWELYPKKVKQRIEKLLFAGFFTAREAEDKQMRLVTGREGMLSLYWLVDESDGIIADAKFQAFGPPPLLAIGDVASELILRKNYDQASRISADLLEQQLKEPKGELPFDCRPFLNQALQAIDRAVYQCLDIPFAATPETTPIQWDLSDNPNGLPGWEELPDNQKISLIKEVVEKEIRPYIELDAGGIQIVALKEGKEVVIAYEGSCTSCHASTGSTLSAIQQILRARLHPSLSVSPQV